MSLCEAGFSSIIWGKSFFFSSQILNYLSLHCREQFQNLGFALRVSPHNVRGPEKGTLKDILQIVMQFPIRLASRIRNLGGFLCGVGEREGRELT